MYLANKEGVIKDEELSDGNCNISAESEVKILTPLLLNNISDPLPPLQVSSSVCDNISFPTTRELHFSPNGSEAKVSREFPLRAAPQSGSSHAILGAETQRERLRGWTLMVARAHTKSGLPCAHR